MVAMRGCRGRDLLNFGGGQVSHKEKQQEIGRNVKVEIDQRMYEESGAGDDTGQLQRARKGTTKLPQPQQGLAAKNRQEPSAA